MSVKSILLISGLLMILNSQNNIVRADYSFPSIDAEEEIEAAQSMRAMRPLPDLEHPKVSLSEFEPPSPMKNFTLMTEKVLDKQEIPGLSEASFLNTELQDQITTYQLSVRVSFTPPAVETGDSLKKESWLEKIERKLQNLAPYLDPYGGYGMLY
jgi:hypothetical protein